MVAPVGNLIEKMGPLAWEKWPLEKVCVDVLIGLPMVFIELVWLS